MINRIKLIKLLFCFYLLVVGVVESAKAAQYTHANIADSPRYAALVQNVATGEILFSKNAHLRRHPASLTKMMTLHLVFDALKSGKLYLNQTLPVSKKAAMQPRSNLGLRPGSRIAVKDAIYGLIIKSANDASVVLAEAIAGSEWQFSAMMNQKAKSLGMHDTNFTNASGLHNPYQVTTAYDMAILGRALVNNHPNFYPLFSKPSFYFKGRIVNGHNHVMKRYSGVEGLKTGYVAASGFNLVTTAKKPNGRLIGVVLGGNTAKQRDDHMIQLLSYGFSMLTSKKNNLSEALYAQNTSIKSPNNIHTAGKILSANNEATYAEADLPFAKAQSTVFSIVDPPAKDVFSVAEYDDVHTLPNKKLVSNTNVQELGKRKSIRHKISIKNKAKKKVVHKIRAKKVKSKKSRN